MDQKPIDAVALGLKRGPRSALGVAVLIIAALAVVVATRAESVTVSPPPEQAPETPPAVSAVAPTKKTKPSATKRKKVAVPPAVVEKPVAIAQPKPEAPAPVAIAPLVEVARVEPKVEQPEPLAPPPPPPAPEPEEEVAPAPAAAVAPVAEPVIEVDGNGAAIARLIADSKRAAVRACFESELKQAPKLRGTVVVELDLAPPNKVSDVRVSDNLERPAFTRCVRATMQTIHFTGLDEELSVSVPYNLTPQAK
ncbi:MAG: AgmX/PglI C-terminal domain-containing protein [Archangium sp.]